ncbi:MAG: glycosyltransferase family 2 protein [Phycisphaerales bacterium]|nr:MAG: glycosyltransferase family 2 protein [Phycisphaerales bacterium]
MPVVSIIIPNYNHARFLVERVDSVLRQTYRDFDVIVLDDASTDESRDVLKSFAGRPEVALRFNTENSDSTFKQWNKGVELARGKCVWIAESDDFAYRAEPWNYYRFRGGSVRSGCLTSGVRDVEDLRVYRHLLESLSVSRNETRRICDRIVRRWIRRMLARAGRRIRPIRNREVLCLLKDMVSWYRWHIFKQVLLGTLGGGIRSCLNFR